MSLAAGRVIHKHYGTLMCAWTHISMHSFTSIYMLVCICAGQIYMLMYTYGQKQAGKEKEGEREAGVREVHIEREASEGECAWRSG